MLLSPHPPQDRLPARLLLSIASHAALFGLVVLITLHTRVRPVYHQSRCCTVALYWSGTTNMGNTKAAAAPRTKKARKPTPPAPAVSQSASPAPAPQSASSQSGPAAPQQQPTAGAGTGSEDAEPAFPVFYPTPGVPDRSLLPATERKVIVDVQISSVGEVIDAKLVQGLGNNVDQIVLDTVRGWRFRPATLNGAAIASMEELVFPFSRNAPSLGPATGA